MHACINHYRLVKLNLTEKITEERNRLKSHVAPRDTMILSSKVNNF